MNKNIWLIIVLVVVAGFLVYAYTRTPHAPEKEVPGEKTYAWRFESAGESEFEGPKTHVFLDTNAGPHDLGLHSGSCTEIPAEGLLQGEVSGALCWWAGGGDELGVFKEGDTYFVRKGAQEEPSAESEGFRGNFETLFTL